MARSASYSDATEPLHVSKVNASAKTRVPKKKSRSASPLAPVRIASPHAGTRAGNVLANPRSMARNASHSDAAEPLHASRVNASAMTRVPRKKSRSVNPLVPVRTASRHEAIRAGSVLANPRPMARNALPSSARTPLASKASANALTLVRLKKSLFAYPSYLAVPPNRCALQRVGSARNLRFPMARNATASFVARTVSANKVSVSALTRALRPRSRSVL